MTQVPRIKVLPKGADTHHVKLAEVTVTHDGGVTQVVYTTPPGWLAVVDKMFVGTNEAWNGTGADVDIGMSDDHDGFLDGSAVTVKNAGIYGFSDDAELGAFMYNSTDKRPLRKFLEPGDVINAYVTPGTGHTAGLTRIIAYGFLVKY